MRPTVSEQLDGIRHVLADVVSPQVADDYAASILDGLLASLDALAAGWRQVPQFLRWDAEQTAVVLTAAAPGLDQGLIDDLDVALADAPDDELDLARLESHHRRLRGLLERAVPAIVEQPNARDLLVAHLRSRIARFPVTSFPPAHTSPHGGPDADAAR